jgi:hypothetical protein
MSSACLLPHVGDTVGSSTEPMRVFIFSPQLARPFQIQTRALDQQKERAANSIAIGKIIQHCMAY